MPPRYAYWTIIADGLPTAFRARIREDLLPVFRRLQEQHPDAVLKWFSQGTLWDSPEAATEAREKIRSERRDPRWRPGGSHRDPRQKFIDEQKRKNQARRKKRFDERATASTRVTRKPDSRKS